MAMSRMPTFQYKELTIVCGGGAFAFEIYSSVGIAVLSACFQILGAQEYEAEHSHSLRKA